MKKAKKKLKQNTRKNREKAVDSQVSSVLKTIKSIKSMADSMPETHDCFLMLTNNDKGYSFSVILDTQVYLLNGKVDIAHKVAAIYMKAKKVPLKSEDYLSNFVVVWESDRLKTAMLAAQNEA